MTQVEYDDLRVNLALELGAVAYKYDTDHNGDEWLECLELADAALNVLYVVGVVEVTK